MASSNVVIVTTITCNYEAKQKGSIDLHMSAKHDGVIFRCDKCAYKTGFKSALNQHSKSHNQGTPSLCNLKCNECDQTFKSNQGLNWAQRS